MSDFKTQNANENGAADVTPGEETVLLADNVDEFIQRTRWKQILTARQNASDALRDVGSVRARYRRKLGERAAEREVCALAASAVTSYALECEPLFQETAAGQKLWRETRLTTVPAERLFEPQDTGRGEEIQRVTNIEFAAGASVSVSRPPARRAGQSLSVTLDGVKDFIELSDAHVRYDYEASIRSRNPDATASRSGSASVSLPIEVTREAFRATNALLSHLGPGLEVGEENREAGGKYTDALDDLQEEGKE